MYEGDSSINNRFMLHLAGTSTCVFNHLFYLFFTCHFKVIYRSGVSEKCPEGDKWIEIPSPQVSITQLSVSPSGVVWGVTWEGVAVVRVGVTYYQPTGEEEI